MSDACTHSKRQGYSAFTIIELLIVIGIIAVLISILVPALGKARKQARRVMCMANQRSVAQAVHGFAAEHQGYGQLLASGVHWQWVSGSHDRYVFETTGTTKILSPWPIAYASYLGAPGLRTEELIAPSIKALETGHVDTRRRGADEAGSTQAVQFRDMPVLQCPAARKPIGEIGLTSLGDGYARISYQINSNIFHGGWGPYAQNPSLNRHFRSPFVWRNGKSFGGYPLAGRLADIVRPAEVLMFLDGGGMAAAPYEKPAILS